MTCFLICIIELYGIINPVSMATGRLISETLIGRTAFCFTTTWGSVWSSSSVPCSGRTRTFNLFKTMQSKFHNKLHIHVRPLNINWKDWKYSSFMVFIHHKHQTSQYELSEYKLYMADVVKNIGLKLQFQSSFSILFNLT